MNSFDIKPSTIEEFIQQFQKIEKELDVFVQCKDASGFPWWDMVRYSLQYDIAQELGLFGDKGTLIATPTTERFRFLKNAIINGVGLTTIVVKGALADWSSVSKLYVSSRSLAETEKHVGIGQRGTLIISRFKPLECNGIFIKKNYIDNLMRLACKYWPVPRCVHDEAHRICTILKQSFGLKNDYTNVVINKYRHACVSGRLWGHLLSRLKNTSLVYYVQDDTLRQLVAQAHLRGLKVCELQHGYMGRRHFAFSYPKLSFNLSTLPDEVLITRDTGDIVYPVRQVALKWVLRSNLENKRECDVLIGSSPTWQSQTVLLCRTLSLSKLNVAVKLHPSQTIRSCGLLPFSQEFGLKIICDDIDFKTAVARAKIYIPANPTSTTVFEAVENGAKLLVVNFNGKKVTSLCDDIAHCFINDIDELLSGIQGLLTCDE